MPRPRSPSAPHLVPAPPPWVEERPLVLEVEPGPRRACRRCGGDRDRQQAEVDAAGIVIHELTELLDWLRAELMEAHAARESAAAEALELRALLGEYDDQVRGYLQALARARKAFARLSEERRLALNRAAKLERYVAALEGRAREVAEAGEHRKVMRREPGRASAPAPRGGARSR